jgi:hypothetical protein
VRAHLRSLSIHLAVLAGMGLLALLHTHPLVWHLDTHLPGQGFSDNLGCLWNAWWMRTALATSHEFFTCPLVQAPSGATLALHTHTALPAFLGATILGPLPLVRAHNLLLIASIALNGFAAYVLALVVTGARRPAVFAGVLFLVAPAVGSRLMGHYNLVLVWPLALACAACVAWWRRPCAWRAVVTGAAAAAIPYADYYYAVFFALFAAAYGAMALLDLRIETRRQPAGRALRAVGALAAIALAAGIVLAILPEFELRLGPARLRMRTPTNALTAAWLLGLAAVVLRWRPRLVATRRAAASMVTLRAAAPGAAVCALLVLPVAAPAWTAWTSGDYRTQTAALKSRPSGVDVATFVLGPPFGGLAGESVRQAYARLGLDVMESSGWLGIVPMVLLVVALRRSLHLGEVRRWLAVGAVFGLWALGPYLTVFTHNSGILLPQALAQIVPLVDNARVPGRAVAMVHLSAVVLIAAALASGAVPAVSGRRLWLFGALAIAESAAVPLPLARLPPAGVHGHIAASAGTGAVLTLPFGVRDGFGEQGRLEHDALYGQTIHGRPLVGGFLARVPPRVWAWYQDHEPYRTLLALSTPDAQPTPLPDCDVALAGLRAAAVEFVVVHPRTVPAALQAMIASSLPLRRVAADGERVLFVVDHERGCGHPANGYASGAPRLEPAQRDRPRHLPAPLRDRAEPAGGDRLDDQVAGGRRLDRPGQHRLAGRIGGGLIEEGVAGAAADDVDARDRGAGEPFDRRHHAGVPVRERVEDHPGDAGRLARQPLARRRELRPDRVEHARRVEQGDILHVDQAGAPRQRRRAGDERVVVGRGGAPLPPARLEQPQPHHVAKESDRAAGTALVGEVRGPGLGGDERRCAFHADERPGARGDVGPARGERRADDRAGGVVRRRRHHADSGPAVALERRPERPEIGTRLDERRHDRGRHADRLEQRRRPGPRAGVEQLGGRRVGVLAGARPAQEQVAEVGQHQQPIRRRRQPVADVGGELVDGVDRHELDAGAGEDRVAPEPGADVLHHAVGARVAVGDRLFEDPAAAVDQAIVHAPGVDADAGDWGAARRGRRAGRRHPVAEPLLETREIPSQVPGREPRSVGEAVHLLERERRPGRLADQGPAAARAEIEGDVHRVQARSRRNTSVSSRDTGRSSACEGISSRIDAHQRRQTPVSPIACQRASSSTST